MMNRTHFAFCKYNINCEHHILITPIEKMNQITQQNMVKIIMNGPFIIMKSRGRRKNKKYIGCTIYGKYDTSYESIQLVEFWEHKQILDYDWYDRFNDVNFSMSPNDLYQKIIDKKTYVNKNIVACVVISEVFQYEKPSVFNYFIKEVDTICDNVDEILLKDIRIARVAKDSFSSGKIVLCNKEYESEMLVEDTHINGLAVIFIKQE